MGGALGAWDLSGIGSGSIYWQRANRAPCIMYECFWLTQVASIGSPAG